MTPQGETSAEAREQLARDLADFCRPTDKPYLPWDFVRVLVGGHEYATRVDSLDVGLVDGAWQVVVFTSDSRVWQQSYLGGWMISWHGPKARYEPLMSASGDNRIVGRRDELLDARRDLRKEVRRDD